MVCDKYQDWLSIPPGESLTGEQQVQLDAHLATCGACQGVAAMLRELDEHLGAAPLIPAPLDFNINVMVAIHEEQLRPRARLSALLVVLCLLVTAGVLGSLWVLISGLLGPIFAFAYTPDALEVIIQSIPGFFAAWQETVAGIAAALRAIRAVLLASPLSITVLGLMFGLALGVIQITHQLKLKTGVR